MDTLIIILIVVGIPIVLFIGIIMWIKSNKQQMYEIGKQLVENYEERFKKAGEANALVVNIENSKVMSDMRGKMKVDLRLEIQMQEGENYLVTDSWLVDMTAVSHIQPGESIPVKVDIVDKNKVYPNVEWAGYWLYN